MALHCSTTRFRGGYRICVVGCTLKSCYAVCMHSNENCQDLSDFGTAESDTFEIV